jgi:hypothetical protein
MKVYTYHSHIAQLADRELLELWRASWKRHGWDPHVLNSHHAHSASKEMFANASRSPLLRGRNPYEYLLSTMLRWVAMLKIQEPCLHVDWDVMCNGLSPADVKFNSTAPVFLAGSTCPCALAAKPAGWKLLAKWLELAPLHPKFSAEACFNDSADQYATMLMPPELHIIHDPALCLLYKEEEGWERAPMIHFPNRLTPYPRSATVREVLHL